MGALVRYYRAKDERQTIVLAERMSQTKSPLTEEELLETLKDPRFNVRFEAVISIARMDASPHLVDALCRIVDGTEVSLSVVAAWALGRLGDARALPTLRRGLDSHYRSVQAHCARALGTIGDRESIPLLHERLREETDKGLRMAYAAALGSLHAGECLGTLCDALRQTENEGARMELALALGRIAGREDQFIKLLRSLRQDRGSATSQAVDGLKRRLKRHGDAALLALAEQCTNAFAREHFDEGIALLVQIIRAAPPALYTHDGRALLEECAARLAEFGDSRDEYLVLALHTLIVTAQETTHKPA
jgi:HEAT repeat protein